MFGIITIGILLLSMVSTGAYSIMMMMENVQKITLSQNEKSNLKSIELSIINSLLPLSENGELIAPLGDTVSVSDENTKGNPDADNVHQHLPYFIPSNKTNAWGNSYVYCPFGDNISSSESVSYGDSTYYYDEDIPSYVSDKTADSSFWTTYDVSHKVIDDYQGIPYSSGVDYSLYGFSSDYINDNDTDDVLAVIISRIGNSDSVCEDLTYNATKNKFYTESKNDIVLSITRETSELYQSNNPVTVNTDNENTSDVFTLNGLSSRFDASNSNIYSVEINNDSDREITGDIDFFDEFSDSSRKVKIEGYSSSDKSKIYNQEPSSSPREITFDGVSVLLKDMDFGSGINFVFKNSTVVFDNVKIAGKSYFKNSNVSVINELHLKPRNNLDYLFKFNASTFNIDNDILVDVQIGYDGDKDSLFIAENGSKIIVQDDVTVTDELNSGTNSSLFYADNTSSVIIGSDNRVDIEASYYSNYLFDIEGTININNTDVFYDDSTGLSPSVAILLNNGSRINIVDSNIGKSSSEFSVGVYDDGASFISGVTKTGKEVNIYASTCASGDLFDQKISASSTKQDEDENNSLNNKSEWNCK